MFKLINFYFYILREGFKSMPGWAKKLWFILILKLIVMFFLIRPIFFPNYLKKNFKTDDERSKFVIEHLTQQIQNR